MAMYFLALLFAFVVPFAMWAVPTYFSFHARQRSTIRVAAAMSAIFTSIGALGVLAWTAVDDFNDYPGYTCTLRDGYVPDGLPDDWFPPVTSSPTDSFPPTIGWSSGLELFPVGMRCSYWVTDNPEFTITTHSHWLYTLVFYGLIGITVLQIIRAVRANRTAE